MAKKIIILGGGLAGLSAGWALSRAGHQVTLVEQQGHNGGLAITKTRGSVRYDLGPHNIHSVHHHIIHFLKKHFPQMFEHRLSSKVYKYGTWVDYPLKGIRVLTTLPFWKIPVASISFFAARVRMFANQGKPDTDFKVWIENRFGKVLCWEYFSRYAEKVWKIPADQIDRVVAEKRIPIINLTELIKGMIFRSEIKVNHPEFQAHNYYLPDGIGDLPDFFEKGLRSSGNAQILNQSRPTKITTNGNRIRSVTIESQGGQTSTLEADYVLSTIPLPSLIRLFEGTSVSSLDYCSSILLFLHLKKSDLLPSQFVYFSEPDVAFSRVYDVGAFSKKMVPNGTSLLCLEFPCNTTDWVWSASTSTLQDYAAAHLEKVGIIDRKDIQDSFVEKIEHSYPRFRVGYAGHLKTSLSFLKTFDNILTFGRQGAFAYINTDTVIHHGLHAADAVLSSETLGYSCWDWFEAHVKL